MPRRRAVRVIGASLAAIAVPGSIPRLARAQVGCTARTCGKDERCCQKGAEADFETYCCPRPSWRFQCGGQDNGYRCINVCKSSGTNYPCTGLVADRFAGVNGVCCDSRHHERCVPHDPKELASGGGSRPRCDFCIGKMCGPDPRLPGGIPGRWNCCKPPATCRKGICRCPNGRESCGAKCCARSDICHPCLSVGTLVQGNPNSIDGAVIGKKCCPSRGSCCGSTCCKEFGCCDTKCCPVKTSRCAVSGGKKVCCPRTRALITDAGYRCCPPGTVAPPFHSGCCPPSDLECCGPAIGKPVACGRNQTCVHGTCVSI
jgi:hypothetical protein